MNFLIDPNVSYLLLVCGLVLGILALLSPGTGILELVSILLLVLSGYGIYNLPVNTWALGIIALGVIAFFIALRVKTIYRWSSLAVSTICLIIGSIFLYKTSAGEAAIHPVFIIVTTILVEGLLYWIGSKTLDATHQKPSHDLDRIINMIGTAHSDILAEGSAYVDGEEWTARSETLIPAGTEIKVTGREGLLLMVEPVSEQPRSQSSS